ncbi:MAG: hypothetical protein Q4G26_12680 [Paracoccus sp. (in: a-proteobacteria)]|nr:hypothetical protein [Paracoccus sp. (in: a-proteobacteria)]
MQRYRKHIPDDPTRSGLREMSIMHVFRDSAARRDSRDPDQHYSTDGERDLTVRSQKRRDGTDEAALRHNIAQDVASLMNPAGGFRRSGRQSACRALGRELRLSGYGHALA